MKFFETHCHLDFPDYNRDRNDVIRKCIEDGVKYFVNVGTESKTIKSTFKLADEFPNIYASAGYHPHYVDSYDGGLLAEYLTHPKTVAVGEIGLDYYRNHTPRDLQKKVFADQLKLAEKYQLPVIIHNRDAHNDCLDILNGFNLHKVVLHCYSGNIKFAETISAEGWYISLTAAITYKNCKVDDVIKEYPLNMIMTETDCPFLAPQIIRGKRNDPSYLYHVVKRISEIRNLPEEDVAETLFDNACNFFLKKA